MSVETWDGEGHDKRNRKRNEACMRIVSRVLAALLLAGGIASATTITFDDLPGPSVLNYGEVPDGYSGLHWNGFGYFKPPQHYPANYDHAMVSASFIAGNCLVGAAGIASDDLFTLNDGYFTSAGRDYNVFLVSGWAGGIEVHNTRVVLNSQAPTRIVFDWVDIDQVVFMGTAGAFAADNLTINAVPTPEGGATLALLGLGLLGLLALRRRLS